MLKTWSYSRLTVFEQCPYRAKLQYLDKIPEPARPLPPGKTEHANDRGTRLHDAAEMYVKGDVELLPELSKFAAEFASLKELRREGKASLEGEWGFDRSWNPVGWYSDDVWGRVKLDAMVTIDDTHAVIIDYKSGKRQGNEVKHAEQCQLYGLATLDRNPKLEKITVELWYLDIDDHVPVVYDANDLYVKRKGFTERALALTDATEFPKKPSIFNCRWCPYGPKGTGHCPEGVQK